MMHKVISLMSGTSLDGVDIACCEYRYENGWSFKLLACETIPYDSDWENKLRTAHKLSALDFVSLNVDYGYYLGNLVKSFCLTNALSADYVSSHGHTIFHQPMRGVTVQIGSGAAISAACELPVVCDFRTMDVALKGQGAPLVPIGDKLLFSEYDYCLNLGGIANISFEVNNERKAFDVSACNIVLNHYASLKGMQYDNKGELAANGAVHKPLLKALSKLEYYSLPFPKSLGREDIDRIVFPIIDSFQLPVEDVLATFSVHIAEMISSAIHNSDGKIIVTGGGAFNTTLIRQIAERIKLQMVVPEEDTINFKEAIIFGFLGVLRMEKQINCLKSVTGATVDTCGGAIYYYQSR